MKRSETKNIISFKQVTVLTAFVLGISFQLSAQKVTVYQAAFYGNVKAMKEHIEAKSDLNQKDEYGSSPLHISSVFNKPEIAKLLIDAGADLNIKSADGSTPLHNAAFFCRKEIAEMLLNAGADASIRNNFGSTAKESLIAPFDSVKPIYDQMSRELGPFGFKLNYDYVQTTRPEIIAMIDSATE